MCAIAHYRKAIDQAYHGTDPALLDRSAANFARALKRKFDAIIASGGGHVGQA